METAKIRTDAGFARFVLWTDREAAENSREVGLEWFRRLYAGFE